MYHATARDQKPGVDASVSESFLIEIGKVAGIASTGFALPDDRERQSLSQQMLIVKTERLEAERPALTADALTEQAKLLGIEQRMVRAEFVFMTGGEVEDEVEEAAAAHELTEGRLENQGQAELLTAVREMSRAEARLNAADTAGALIFERAALRALQRAFDRRRYLLRATPERARIDLDRRLQGDLTHARSSVQERRDTAADPVVARARAAMLELAARDPSAPSDASLAATILSVEPGSEALRTAALRLSSARTPDERRAATIAVAQQLDELVRARLAAPAAWTRAVQSAARPRGRRAVEVASMIPRLLRAAAVAIAIAGVVDPVLSRERREPPPLAVVVVQQGLVDADAVQSAATRVQTLFGDDFDVTVHPHAPDDTGGRLPGHGRLHPDLRRSVAFVAL